MESLNLIRDRWIPFRHRSGRRTMRAPWDLFGEPDDPAVAVASARADFDGCLMQFLIGLLQIALAPRTENEWIDRAKHPPSTEALRALFEPWADAFELLGSGPRFQQDSRLAGSEAPEWRVEKLLIDLGLSEGQDHFARNGSVPALCLPCAAAALATLQASAPTGGRGHLVSLRGGGPLTTLVIPTGTVANHEGTRLESSIWLALWLNVLPLDALRTTSPDPSCGDEVFPWLNTAKAPEPERPTEFTPLDVHPLQVFFSMPRRLWLSDPVVGDCGVCGSTETYVCLGYQTRPHGIRYTGAWLHPLSPHRRFKQEQWLCFKGDESGIGYRHWLGLVVAPASTDVQPALTVQQLRGHAERLDTAGALRLWAFGYAMDNMRALAWSEGVMPIYQPRADLLEQYADEVRKLVQSAELVERYLRFAFKKLVARRAQDVKREPDQISARFWETTEPHFYERARAALVSLELGNDALPEREAWHKDLIREASRLFEEEVGEADFRAAQPRQVAMAWGELRRSLYGRKLKTLLELPVEKTKSRKHGAAVEEGVAQ